MARIRCVPWKDPSSRTRGVLRWMRGQLREGGED
uniref:Uncharacterized protein n=1 Tax=Arundo donax TaxID=35708 RepID=A0A0A9GWF1_ARUDO